MEGGYMTPWIQMRNDLEHDTRVQFVAEILKVHPLRVVGGLYMLWALGDAYTADGRLIGYTARKLDARFGKRGFSEALASREVNWLEIGEGYLQIPRFEEKNGASAKARAVTSKRVTKHRDRNADVTPPSLHHPPKSNGASVTGALQKPLPDEDEDEDEERTYVAGAGNPDGGDRLDSEIRQFISAHAMLTYHPKAHAKCRKLVLAVGWERAKEYVDDAVAAKAPAPIGWALGKAENISQAERAAKKNEPPRRKLPGSKPEFFNT